MLNFNFFNRDPCLVAKELLGKRLVARHNNSWLKAIIIETEAYYLSEKSSHSSKGYTHKRRAMFMDAGTIYMYYSRGGDSMNISVAGEGNAVLVKAGFPYEEDKDQFFAMINTMQKLNPQKNKPAPRTIEKLCSGQTLLCKSLGITVKEWDAKEFDQNLLFIEDINYTPEEILQGPRLGIPAGRDEHLPYRFVDAKYRKWCTKSKV